MGVEVITLRGAQHLRQRLLLATLAGCTLRIKDIRANDSRPGLRDFELSFLRLLEKVSNGCVVEISPTGTRLGYKPGILIGGRDLVHDCGTARPIGYFLESLLVLGLFGKKPLTVILKGITNGGMDPSMDTFRTTTLPILKHFGVPTDSLELKVVRRGAPPLGGGEVRLKVPMVATSLTAVSWIDEGMVKRVRGVAYSARVSPQMSNRMVDSARGVLNPFLPDVYIFTDHSSGSESGHSPGYGVSLVAETTTGCLLSAEGAAITHGEDDEAATKDRPVLPEDIGARAAMSLLEEIKEGGVVDSTHQSLLFTLCALCPEDVSKVGGARKQYKVFYPTMYALESENKDAKLFNCVQRGHQNALEYMPTFLVLLLLGGLQYPIVAGALGALYNVGRIQYFRGYATGHASARYQGGGGFHWLGLMGLLVCTIALLLHQFFPAYV